MVAPERKKHWSPWHRRAAKEKKHRSPWHRRAAKEKKERELAVIRATRYVAEHVVGIRPALIKSFAKLGGWTKKTIKLLIPLAVLLFFTFVPMGIDDQAKYALGIFLFIALMWTFESLPLPVTALMVPVLLVIYDIFPGPDDATQAFAPFATPVVYLVLGGIIISVAFRKTHLDKRFALFLVAKSKGDFNRLLLAIMLACGTLSMWISNTATVALLIPVAIGIAGRSGASKDSSERLALVLLLGIGASAAIGGMATIVGTSANAVSSQFIAEEVLAVGGSWTFLSWMKVGLPLSLVLLFISWKILVRQYPLNKEKLDVSWVQDELEKMGKMEIDEKKVLVILIGTIIFWIIGGEIAALILPQPWSPGAFANAAIVSMIAAILLFVTRTLTWEDARLIPWGLFLILGAGLALGAGLNASGFNTWLSGSINVIANPLVQAGLAFVFLFLAAFVVVSLSNFMNNTATVAFFVPSMIALASSISIGDMVLMKLFALSVAFAAAIAFITPVSHPPSTLIYGSGMVSRKDMFKSGLAITIPSVIIVVIWIFFTVQIGWV